MEIQSSLLNLGYNVNISEQIFKEGPPNSVFIDVIVWLNSELLKVCELENIVSHNPNAGDSLSFLVEVSSLLRELCCPYKSLTEGNISERFIHSEHKKRLITYLCTELESAKILTFKNRKKESVPIKIELDESNTARKLKEVLIYLQFSKPPETVTLQQIFAVIEKRLKQLSQPSTPKEKVGELLFTGCLTEKHWFQLEYLYKEMYEEYKVRRALLLTRLDVTVKSFSWSDKLKAKCEKIINIYEKCKSDILLEPMVKISDILAAKSNLALIEKASSAFVRKNTKSSLNSVIIGAVPDRGGRPEEQPPPALEVSSYKKNYLTSRGSFKLSNQPHADNKGYNRDNANNKIFGSAPQEYPKSIVSKSHFSKKENISRGNKGFRNSSHETFAFVYQHVNYGVQSRNPEFGFGGYMPAGNDYQEYGITYGDGQINHRNYYQTRASYRRPGLRYRGGNNYRGSNQSHND